MDWQKYPKRRKSIRILQPETLDSIKRHTFPVMGGRTLDFPLHDPALQFFFVPNVLIEMPAHTNSFIVLCNGLKSEFLKTVYKRVCQVLEHVYTRYIDVYTRKCENATGKLPTWRSHS